MTSVRLPPRIHWPRDVPSGLKDEAKIAMVQDQMQEIARWLDRLSKMKIQSAADIATLVEAYGYLTQAAADALYAAISHTHTKSEVTDLETITTTPTADAVPKADGSGDIAAGWIPDLSATYATVASLAAYVAKALFDANTILAANSDDTPAALTVDEQRLVGRITGGNIAGLTAAQVRALIGLTAAAAADITVNDCTVEGDLAHGVAGQFALFGGTLRSQASPPAAASTSHSLDATYDQTQLESALNALGAAINAVADLIGASSGIGVHSG